MWPIAAAAIRAFKAGLSGQFMTTCCKAADPCKWDDVECESDRIVRI
jgi:hypothetical protein